MDTATWDFPIVREETDHKEFRQILLTIRHLFPLFILNPMHTEACKREKKRVSCRAVPRYLRARAIRYAIC